MNTRWPVLLVLLTLPWLLGLRRDLPQEEVNLHIATHYGSGTCSSTTLNAAISALGSTVATLTIPPYARYSNTPCTWTLTSPVTFPPNITLLIPARTVLTPNPGITVTLGSCPLADRRQIYNADEVTTGLIRYGTNCATAYPEHWGTGDTTVELASRALTTYGGVVSLGAKTYTQDTVEAVSKVHLVGQGVGLTTLRHKNDGANSVYGTLGAIGTKAYDEVLECGVHQMTIDNNAAGQSAYAGLTGIPGQFGFGAISARSMTRCHFSDLRIINSGRDCINSLKSKDLVVENIACIEPRRSGVVCTGSCWRNHYRNLNVYRPYSTCFDIEPSTSQAADLHVSGIVMQGLTCYDPGNPPGNARTDGACGLCSTFGLVDQEPTLSGTREGNTFSDINVVYTASNAHGGDCVILADLNETTMTNVSCLNQAAGASSHGIVLGSATVLPTKNIALSTCTVEGFHRNGLYISDGTGEEELESGVATVTGVSVSGCVLRNNGRRHTGTHTGSNNSTTLSDTTVDFTTYFPPTNPDALAGVLVENATDGSVARISGWTTTQLTFDHELRGGTDNHWDTGDVYYLRRGSDLRVDALVSHVTISGTVAETTSFGGAVAHVNITTMGQAPQPVFASSTGALWLEGLYDTYYVSGTTPIDEVSRRELWPGRGLTLRFLDTPTPVRHSGTVSLDLAVPLELARSAHTAWCSGDQLALRYTVDPGTATQRVREAGRSKAAGEVTVTGTDPTPSVACASAIRFLHGSATNVTNLQNAEDNLVYTLHFDNTNTTLKDQSGGGNFQLEGNTDKHGLNNDIVQVYRPAGATHFRQVAPLSANDTTQTGGQWAEPGADDQLLVSDGASAVTWRTLPNCNTGNMLTYTTATNTFSCEADDTGAGGGDASAVHINVSGEIVAITDKATPVSTDHLLIEDSQASNAKKDITIASLQPALEGVLALPNLQGTLPVAKGGSGAAPSAGDQVLVADSTTAATWRTLPNCNTGSMLTYTTATNTIGCEADDVGAGGGDAAAIHNNVSGEIVAIADKTTPVAGDHLLIEDSQASNAKKDITIGSIPLQTLGGAVTDTQVPHLNTLSTGLTASRCVETNASGILVSAAGVCGTASGSVSDTTYGAGWNGATTTAPSQNAVYDKMETMAPLGSPTFTGTVTLPANTTLTTPTLNGGARTLGTTTVSTNPYTMQVSDCGKLLWIATGAGEIDLIADPTNGVSGGSCYLCFVEVNAVTLLLDPNSTDTINATIYNRENSTSLSLSGGDRLQLANVAGNTVCLAGRDASTWWVMPGTLGTATDAN